MQLITAGLCSVQCPAVNSALPASVVASCYCSPVASDQTVSKLFFRCCNRTDRHCSIMNEHPFNGPFSRTTRVSQYQKGKTNLDFTEARDSEWQWHQLGHMQVCISLQTDK